MACVLAMIVNETEQYVRDWFDFSPPYSDQDAALFLIHHGIIPGIVFGVKPNHEEIIYDFTEKTININYNLRLPAIITVKSQRFSNMTHVIFWDGDNIHDPNPEAKYDGTGRLTKYKILQWTPLTPFHQGNGYIVEILKNKHPELWEGNERWE
jgi:hypothetical protein